MRFVMAAIQAHVIFKGHVQGVGFRFTVQRIARNLGVCGWVKNLFDNDVEVVAEAEQLVVDTFLEKIRDSFSRYIVDEQIQISQPVQRLNNFEIRF